MERRNAVAAYLTHKNWMLQPVDASQVRFLAAGEYNENWLIRCNGRRAVFRINHGSQIGQENQIGYEFSVLQSVASSGVTPLPYKLDAAAGAHGFGNGALLMEYLPGTSLDYQRHSMMAAALFARVHSCPLPPEGTMIEQRAPVCDIATECSGLLSRQPDHPRKDIHTRLVDYRDEVLRLADDTQKMFAEEPLVITNTEVNSGNFIVLDKKSLGPEDRAFDTSLCLVDWEKAVISCCQQDLGHFLVPTTTRWKTEFTFDSTGRMDFLRAYLKARYNSEHPDELEALHLRTQVLERTILLRALSWCYMAWYEYKLQDRALRDDFTFKRIASYLDNIEWILKYGI